jgi:hypothetical protein
VVWRTFPLIPLVVAFARFRIVAPADVTFVARDVR